MKEHGIRLVRAAVKGDREAFGTLMKDYTGFIYTMALRMTADHHLAEDLCQEIFIKAWLNLRKLKKPEAFPGWLAAIGRRICLNAIEKRKRKREVAEDEAEPASVKPVMPASFDAARIILEEAIAQLSLQDRQLITLCYFEELSSAEVAKVMGLESGTVRVYLMRAREKLRTALKGREDELFDRT